MFRHGKVIDRKLDEKLGPLVRVQYLDKQGLISKWLQVKQPGSRLTMHYYCPKVGDDVNVTMLPNGYESGFVDGSFFNKRNPPPSGVDLDTRHFRTQDGTVIEYREIDSTFNLDARGAANGGGGVAGRAAGAGGNVIVTAGMVEVTAMETIILTAPIIVINGNIQHTGMMNTTGVHTDANGIHMGAARDAEIAQLRSEVSELRTQVRTFEHILKLRGLM